MRTVTQLTRDLIRRSALGGPGEAIAWLIAVGALVGSILTEGAGKSVLHYALFTAGFVILSGIAISRRARKGQDE